MVLDPKKLTKEQKQVVLLPYLKTCPKVDTVVRGILFDSETSSVPMEHLEKERAFQEHMVWVLQNEHGIGLACNQIGYNTRNVFALDTPQRGIVFYYNPEIEAILEDGTVIEREGCLSLPQMEFMIPRHKTIKFTWDELNINTGTVESKEMTISIANKDDLYPIAIQHEVDHLRGKTILDRAVLNRQQRRDLTEKIKKLKPKS